MIEVTEDQVLYFRARRGHLAGPGAVNAVAAARAILGAQSQQLLPSLLALSMRTKGRPTATTFKKEILESRKLVRTWGQRDTLHVYDPAAWADVVAARAEWAPGARGGPMPAETTLDKTLKVMKAASGPVTRTDLLGIAPASYVRAIGERAGAASIDAERFAAARLIWRLAQRGDACVADKVGAQQAYATRSAWFPKLKWPKVPAIRAAAALTQAYLAVYGAATATDVAHFFGARVSNAKLWLAELDGDLTAVRCGDRKGLVALARDIPDLTAKPPAATTKWPLRLLPSWESMLMGHADKTWTVPDEADRKQIWRKAAFVAAVAIARGRVVATWTHKQQRGRLAVEVQPLSRWQASKHAAQVRREATAIAAHLELDNADVTIAN
jgi:hypothetical protein